MQRWISLLVGVAVVGLAIMLMVKGLAAKKGGAGPALADAALADAESLDGGDTISFDAETPDGMLFVSDLPPIVRDFRDSGAGYVMADGTPVPPLPPSAPRRVACGVILVAYAGTTGATRSARTKAAAKDLADKIATDAKADFHAATSKGDVGFDRIGVIERGSLEPATEYVLFTMPVGGVTDALDTPAGYWIAKRLE